MYGRAQGELLDDLRYTLRVMEEGSHLGLDDEAADRVRQILLRQIATIESVLARDSGISITITGTIPSGPEE